MRRIHWEELEAPVRMADLPQVIGAMHRLAAIGCPDLPVEQVRQRCCTSPHAVDDGIARPEMSDTGRLIHAIL